MGSITNILDLNNRISTLEATKTSKFTSTDSFYGTCSTAADVAEKVVTLVNADNFSLRPGVTVTVKFDNTNIAPNPTINVNGSGAKRVWYNVTELTAGASQAGLANRPIRYTYDGTYWVWMGWSIDYGNLFSMTAEELVEGTSTTQKVVRADYLKNGIEQLIGNKVPDAPTTDGIYNLRATVVNGKPTYSWVSTS